MTTPTKERLLDAAEELFAERGYAGTSLRAVTGAARVNLAAAHYHFGGKRELFQPSSSAASTTSTPSASAGWTPSRPAPTSPRSRSWCRP